MPLCCPCPRWKMRSASPGGEVAPPSVTSYRATSRDPPLRQPDITHPVMKRVVHQNVEDLVDRRRRAAGTRGSDVITEIVRPVAATR